MANTVVAIFEDVPSAQQAEKYLLDQGIRQSEINLKTAVYKKQSEKDHDDHHDLIDSIKTFFLDLFGNDDDASRYHAASQNRTIVSVHTITEEDAESVAAVLDRYGAIHVNAPDHLAVDEDENRRIASVTKSRIIQRAVDKQKDNQHL